jgi:hypothetical protein
MKLDLNSQREKVVAGALMTIALLLVGKSGFKSKTPPAEVSVPMAASQLADASSPQKPKRKMNHDTARDPRLDYEQLQLTENRIYEGTGRNIFRSELVVRTRKMVVPPRPALPSRVPEPVLSSIRLRFFGFASAPNEPRKAFLGEDDSVFVASEGEIVDRRYRVLKIDSNSVILEDLLEKSVCRLALPT